VDPREEICNWARELYELRLTTSRGGNLSVRQEDRVFITPSGVHKGRLSPRDIVVTDMQGKVMGRGRPSIELAMHLAVYRVRPDARAVIHAHPVHATALAVAGRTIDPSMHPELEASFPKLPLIPPAPCGSEELANLVAEAVKEADVVLLGGHGTLALGRSVEAALVLTESVEFGAHLLLHL